MDVRFYLDNEATIRPRLETEEMLEGGPSLFPFMKEFQNKPMGAKNMWGISHAQNLWWAHSDA